MTSTRNVVESVLARGHSFTSIMNIMELLPLRVLVNPFGGIKMLCTQLWTTGCGAMTNRGVMEPQLPL
jgi:hypothetical protein